MGCGCRKSTAKNIHQEAAAMPGQVVIYEASGGSMSEPQTFATLGEAQAVALDAGGRVRSKIGEPVTASG